MKNQQICKGKWQIYTTEELTELSVINNKQTKNIQYKYIRSEQNNKQMGPDVKRIWSPTAENIHFFREKKIHVLAHKIILNKYQRIEIIQCMFSDDRRISENSKTKQLTRKSSSVWKLSNDI